MSLVEEIYILTKQFPKEEIYGLTSQMRRAAVSIPSNIAEGRQRGSRNEMRQFFQIAYGSAGELETQLELSKRLKFCDLSKYNNSDILLSETMKMLNKMIKTLCSSRS
ncbi:MAG: 23S ribosomal protein [uncultured bacterium]|nr:MAG: 23S ribosomal protein [uncultured bacterium]